MVEILLEQCCLVFSGPIVIDLGLYHLSQSPNISSPTYFSLSQAKYYPTTGPDIFATNILEECKHQSAFSLANRWRKSLNSVYQHKHFLFQSIIKVLERVVKSSITGFLEGNNLPNSNQHVFHCGRDGLTWLLHQEITRMTQILILLKSVDFSKIFESQSQRPAIMNRQTLGQKSPVVFSNGCVKPTSLLTVYKQHLKYHQVQQNKKIFADDSVMTV